MTRGRLMARGPRRNQWWMPVHVETEHGEPRSYDVLYERCPAEPDVGIMADYIEVLRAEVDGHAIHVDDDMLERIHKYIEEEIYQ